MTLAFVKDVLTSVLVAPQQENVIQELVLMDLFGPMPDVLHVLTSAQLQSVTLLESVMAAVNVKVVIRKRLLMLDVKNVLISALVYVPQRISVMVQMPTVNQAII
jgi:hypothetical protein